MANIVVTYPESTKLSINVPVRKQLESTSLMSVEEDIASDDFYIEPIPVCSYRNVKAQIATVNKGEIMLPDLSDYLL
jgi:hypothetical protein